MELDDEKNNVANVLTNICRCCLSRGCYKDISTEYFWLGQSEIYEKMLKETFNICMTYHEDGDLNTGYRLICDECIQKLREANTFRNLVLQSESKFLKQLEVFKKQFSDTAVVIEKDEKGIKQDDDEHMENDFGGDDLLLDIKVEPKEDDDSDYDITLDTLKKKEAKRKGGLKRKAKRKKERTGVRKRDASTSKGEKKASDVEDQLAGRLVKHPKIYKENLLKLLLNTNVCLFRRTWTKYRCFYCAETFTNMVELRDHSSGHLKETVTWKVRVLKLKSLLKIDISDMECNLCLKGIPDLSEMKEHLKFVHGLKFGYTPKEILVPYLLAEESVRCVICDKEFQAVKKLVVHMNEHYSNYACDNCDKSFPTARSLKGHEKNNHRENVCRVCKETFLNSTELYSHRVKVHSYVCKRRCMFCEETFPSVMALELHKIDVHGVEKKNFVCNCCGKGFLFAFLLKAHENATHYKERKHACDKCIMIFYTKSELNRHLNTTHVDAKNFLCTLCDSRFKSKASLTRHLTKTVHKMEAGRSFVLDEEVLDE